MYQTLGLTMYISMRGVLMAVWFGFEAKSYSICKIKNMQFDLIWLVFEHLKIILYDTKRSIDCKVSK